MIIVDIRKLIHRISHAYAGGLRQLSSDMDINYNTLRSKANHAIETHYFSGEELALLADLSDTNEIAKFFADRRGLMCIQKPDYDGLSDAALLDLFLSIQKEQGEWASEISKALENGEIEEDEIRRIREAYEEFVVAGSEVMNRLETYAEASKQRKSKSRNK